MFVHVFFLRFVVRVGNFRPYGEAALSPINGVLRLAQVARLASAHLLKIPKSSPIPPIIPVCERLVRRGLCFVFFFYFCVWQDRVGVFRPELRRYAHGKSENACPLNPPPPPRFPESPPIPPLYMSAPPCAPCLLLFVEFCFRSVGLGRSLLLRTRRTCSWQEQEHPACEPVCLAWPVLRSYYTSSAHTVYEYTWYSAVACVMRLLVATMGRNKLVNSPHFALAKYGTISKLRCSKLVFMRSDRT